MPSTSTKNSLALWGGIECTINRVGDRYQDQSVRNGHEHRPDDITLFAELGLRTLRYPVLWERTCPNRLDDPQWAWADDRLARLREASIRPIVGLVHHGSGPHYATFDTDEFERDLPRYARQVAERYPWVDAYTPVNEPLTTARFAGLYGYWYPHGRSEALFAQILLRQCRATVRAMVAIRQVRPDAQLIQTEDLGYTHSTTLLMDQADWDNERRWITWDLLYGRVTPDHRFWGYFRRVGIEEKDLWFLVENPCPPSLLGVNHYITSERYLDENLVNYPPHLHGGNGRIEYVDTEVVRAAPDQRIGLAGLLMQTWERYRLPIAVTEAHLGCTVDEQMRWLWAMWQEAEQAKAAGADVQALTVWALLGSYDWHCLLTRDEGHYEPGVFDTRTGQAVPTDLAALAQRLAIDQHPEAIVPPGPGWWDAAVQAGMLVTA